MNSWYRFAALIIDSCTGREMNRYGGRRGIVTSIPWKSPKAFGSSRFIERRHRHRFDNNVRHGYSNFGARLAIQKEKSSFYQRSTRRRQKRGYSQRESHSGFGLSPCQRQRLISILLLLKGVSILFSLWRLCNE